MAVPGRRFSLWRMAALLVVLTSETALGVLLYGLGWYETGGLLRWLACLLLALLPALAAVVMLTRKRFRFSLKTLLVAMALIALFMLFSVRPVLEARQSRRVSRQLAAAGAQLNGPCINDGDYFERIGYDPGCTWAPYTDDYATPVWLRPLLLDVLAVPRDDQVFIAAINNTTEAEILCANTASLPHLEVLQIGGPIGSEAVERLSDSLSQFQSLKVVSIGGAAIPEHCFSGLKSVKALFVIDDWAKQRLSAVQLREIAELPNLAVLHVHQARIGDADLQELSGSKARFMFLKRTGVSAKAIRKLAKALPACDVRDVSK
jgi:hypothetical protein